MSASGTAEKLSTANGIVEIARVFLGMELTTELAQRYVMPLDKQLKMLGWLRSDNSTSVGPVVYLKNRMLEDGVYGYGHPEESDDLPIIYVDGFAKICPVARSKIFHSHLVIRPINLITGMVAGFDWL